MAQIPAEFSLVEHIRIEGWNARCPVTLSARVTLDHAMAEEVIVVSCVVSNVPLWSIIPLQSGGVMLSHEYGLGCEHLMRTATDALEMIETLEAKGLGNYTLSPPI